METEELYKLAEFTPNKGQDELIRYYGTPVCGVAAAGTGKTSTIVVKLVHMDKVMNINPKEIVAVVFTHDGSVDMKSKYREMCSKVGAEPLANIRTFHSFYLSIIKKFYPNVNILGSKDQSRMLLKAMMKHIHSNRDNTYETFTSLLTYIVNNMLRTKGQIIDTPEFQMADIEYDELKSATDEYRAEKKRAGAIDYDDMQTFMLQLLKSNEMVRNYVHEHWKWFIVDEYQDVSKLQMEILKLMVADPSHLIVIGDDDQCIYKWRGSASEYILNMPIYFPGTRRITIDVNYRCPEDILKPFAVSIEHNKDRLEKNITAFNKGGHVRLLPATSGINCSRFIVSDILARLKKDVTEYDRLSDYAILYRTNRQPTFVIDMLTREGVPIRVSSKKDLKYLLCNNSITKDIMNIAELAQNPCDKGLFSKCYKKIMFNTGRKFGYRVVKAMNGSIPWYDLAPKQLDEVRNCIDTMRYIGEKMDNRESFESIVASIYPLYQDFICKLSQLRQEPLVENTSIISYIQGICRESSMTYPAFQQYLDSVKYTVTSNSKNPNGIRVMTMHSCKGLEFPHVYLLNDSDLYCPNSRRVDVLEKNFTDDYVQEYIKQERNLHYVAGTRAKKDLTITYSVAEPSRFIVESGLVSNVDYSVMNSVKEYEKQAFLDPVLCKPSTEILDSMTNLEKIANESSKAV